jgi:hypothetical protein
MQLSSRKSFKNFIAEITTDEILIEQEKLRAARESNSGKCFGTILFTLKFGSTTVASLKKKYLY